MNVVLISTYELGHQPFGLASPAAWLKAAGSGVTCLDLAVEPLDEQAIAAADLIAFYVPMHTATRMAVSVLERVKAINPNAFICFYGLYAPMNDAYLRKLGAGAILGGEFEQGIVDLVARLANHTEEPIRGASVASLGARASRSEGDARPTSISLERQRFLVPKRSGLPALTNYAYLDMGLADHRVVGYAEASRGCKHVCRHCPIVPIYGGRFFVVQPEVVLEDIRRQVRAGARHITFGDPDFFNGPGHAMAIVRALHREFPDLSYDVTIKIEHLLNHERLLAELRETGCLFITSAVEAIDERVLEIFDKRHTRDDFVRAVALCREAGLTLTPTFVTFTPWTTVEGYRELLALLADLDLVDNVAPIQYAIRLLIPSGSKLLELAEVRSLVGPFDEAWLCYPWAHADPRVDALQERVLDAVKAGEAAHRSRRATFAEVWKLAAEAAGAGDTEPTFAWRNGSPQTPMPHLSEPWYC